MSRLNYFFAVNQHITALNKKKSIFFQWTETGINGQVGPHVLPPVVLVPTTEGEHALIQPHRIKGKHVLGTEHKLILALKEHVQVYFCTILKALTVCTEFCKNWAYIS